MKKLLGMFVVLLVLSVSCGRQSDPSPQVSSSKGVIKGVDYTSAIKISYDDAIIYDELLFYVGDSSDVDLYAFAFKQTSVGYKHLLEKTISLCSSNKKDFNKPDVESNLFPSWTDNLFEYSEMVSGFMTGNAEIDMTWYVGENYFEMVCDEEFFFVLIKNKKK